MSREESPNKENIEFVSRFVEACGTSRPTDIQRLLNISYQAAKNYLNGRLPQSNILVAIAERTSYSIDWLLTGRGEKFLADGQIQNTPIANGQMEVFVRRICLDVINETAAATKVTAQNPTEGKIVILQSSDVLSEKAMDHTPTVSEKSL